MSIRVVKYVGPLVAYATYIWIAGSLRDVGPPEPQQNDRGHVVLAARPIRDEELADET